MTPVPSKRPKINSTKGIPNPHAYIKALLGEFCEFAFDEEQAPSFRGKWREEVFKVSENTPVDVEVGTGNGHHFGFRSQQNPDRCLVGLELKYKPLVQSIRRAVHAGQKNARMTRFHAHNIDHLFAPKEIDKVFVHFPDPWSRPKFFKKRIMCRAFLERIYELQKDGSELEFKTDSRDYFLWVMPQVKGTGYEIEFQTLDLHQSEKAVGNYITSFENIFLRQGVPINYALLRKTGVK